MKFVLLAASILFALLTACGMIAIGVGRARSQSNELATLGLGLCSGKPCYMGITPGSTPWNVAVDFTRAYHGYIGGRVLTANQRHLAVAMHADANASNVDAIQFDYVGATDRTSVGHFIQMYGLPCAVVSENARQLWLQYPFGSVDIDLDRGAFTPQSPISKITFTAPRNDMCMYGGPLSAHPWSGFATAGHYQLVRVWK